MRCARCDAYAIQGTGLCAHHLEQQRLVAQRILKPSTGRYRSWLVVGVMMLLALVWMSEWFDTLLAWFSQPDLQP